MSVDEELEHLRNIAAFAKLERSKLKLLAFASALTRFEAGELLFREGEIGDSVYVIISGQAEVAIERLPQRLVLAEIGPDDVIGEIAVLCDLPRTATVRALTNLETLIIPRDVFYRLVTDTPTVGVDFMRLMASRFKRTLDRLIAERTQRGA